MEDKLELALAAGTLFLFVCVGLGFRSCMGILECQQTVRSCLEKNPAQECAAVQKELCGE